jgi:hypothetical protein
VLWVILSLVPQADILRGAGLVCASWRRLAHDEPLLWRRIDLSGADEGPLAKWQPMAVAAVRRSAGRCESFRGCVNGNFLLFLAQRYIRTHIDLISRTPLSHNRHCVRMRACLQSAIAAEPSHDGLDGPIQ